MKHLGEDIDQIIKHISNCSNMSLLPHHRTGTLLIKIIRLKSVISLLQKKWEREKLKGWK